MSWSSHRYALDSTLKELEHISTFIEVPICRLEVSHLPLVSFEYYRCNALILGDNNESMGLAHILPNGIAQDYVLQMLFRLNAPRHQVTAAIISGSDASALEQACREQDIIVTQRQHYALDQPRDIILFPKRQGIKIYTCSSQEEFFL